MARLTWLGHSTALIETGETRVLTDPLLRGRVAHIRRSGPSPAIPDRVDVVLLSHAHHDHLDVPSLRMLPGGATLVVPRGAARLRAFRSLPHELREVDVGERVVVRDVEVRAVPAVHDGRRAPLMRVAGALGYVVEGERRVYFAGDTEVFDGMRDIDHGLDVALLPVSGWGPRLGPGHMDPVDAARAAALLAPRLAVPIHWGTFLRVGVSRRRGERSRSAGDEFAREVARRAPDVRVVVLAPGQTREID